MIYITTFLLLVASCSVQAENSSCFPCTCQHDNIYGGIQVVCSAMNLTHFPLFLSSAVTSLQFDGNKIQDLKTQAFQQLANLRLLDLSFNNISDIKHDAFKGLSGLEVLRLDGNNLLNVEHGNQTVFAHLNQLKVLYVHDTGISVSGRQIDELISLHVLYVDCDECTFNHNILNLQLFSNLTFIGCTKKRLTNSTFVAVPHLQSLTLQNCSIEHIEAGTFEPLQKLRFLDLSWNSNLGVNELSKWCYGLRNSPIQSIVFNYITTLRNVFPLDQYSFQYLRKTSLKELYVDGNVVAYVAKGVLENLPETIQVISAKYTLLGDYTGQNFSGINFISSLKSIDITAAITWDSGIGLVKPRQYSKLNTFLFLPPRLQVINYASRYYRTDIHEHFIFPRNFLKTVILKENLIASITGPVHGADSVTYFDVSSNILFKLGRESLPYNNSLQFINISNNNLGKCLEDDGNGEIFARAKFVNVLDISNNRISSLSGSIFKGLRRIKYLNISNNVLFTFGLSLNHMTDLQHLDLSNNKLQLLPVAVQKDLDVLKKTVINLEGNPLACSCQTLQFLQWVRIRHERIQGLRNMTCRLPNGTRVNLNDMDSTVSQLEKQCSSNVVLIAVTVSSIMCVLVVVGVIAGYRSRWKLRYLYHVGRKGYQVLNQDEELHYRYDAFVSYADEDRGFVIDTIIPELEEKSRLNLCIHERDFLPGAVITENIVTSIQNSRKTLLVLSPSFLESEWCSYEFNMALVDGISRKQNTIVMVLYKKVEMKNVPKDLAIMLSNNSYLEYNTDLHGGIVFWNNLVESINTQQSLN